MLQMFIRHKKPYILTATILTAIFFIIYLRALFLPGLWHGDAFLYLQKDGSFAGNDTYAEYKMNITPVRYGTDITFSVNNITKKYQLEYNKDNLSGNVRVLENGVEIFNGKAIGENNNYILLDEDTKGTDLISIHVGNEPPSEEELFPGYTRLYNWSVAEKHDFRGNPLMMLFALFLALILFLDIKFPNLFWALEHRLEVDGGEPSDLYRFGQKIGYVLISAAIFVCIILTFTTH